MSDAGVSRLEEALRRALGPARAETAWRVVQEQLPQLLQRLRDDDGARADLQRECDRLELACTALEGRVEQLEKELRNTSTDITRRLASDAAIDDLFDEDLGAALHRIAELLGEPSVLSGRS